MKGFLLSLTLIFCLSIVAQEEPAEKLERVVFYSLKEQGSNERIARKGLLIKRKDAPATVLILHGYGVDKYDMNPFRLLFKNYNVMSFDFRAHGEETVDQQSTIGHDEVYDIFAAVDYIKSREDLKDKPLIVYAISMGAATAIEAQSKDQSLFDAMFLDTPFMSSEDFVAHGLGKLKLSILGYEFSIKNFCDPNDLSKCVFNPNVQPIVKYLMKLFTNMDATKIETFIKPVTPITSIKNVQVPCFFVMCKNDEKITEKAVNAIYENHNGIKRLWITNGRRHCDSIFYDPEEYERVVNKFIEDFLDDELQYQEKEKIIREPDELIIAKSILN